MAVWWGRSCTEVIRLCGGDMVAWRGYGCLCETTLSIWLHEGDMVV